MLSHKQADERLSGWEVAIQVRTGTTSSLRSLKDEAADLIERGRVEAAAVILGRAAALDPNDGMLRLRLGRILDRLGRWGRAADAYRDAIDLFRRQGNYERARAACSLFLVIAPADTEVQRLRGELSRYLRGAHVQQRADQAPLELDAVPSEAPEILTTVQSFEEAFGR